jgi:hypothetical protein
MSNNPDPQRFFDCEKKRTAFVPDAYFYDYCNALLPSSKDFWITDIDLYIRDRNNNFMFIEKKCNNSTPSKCQAISYQILHTLIMKSDGCGKLELPYFNINNWQYYGYHLLQFEGTTFEDGKIFFDGKEITIQELTEIMSFKSNKIKAVARD